MNARRAILTLRRRLQLISFVFRVLRPVEGSIFVCGLALFTYGAGGLLFNAPNSIVSISAGFLGLLVRAVTVWRLFFGGAKATLRNDTVFLKEIQSILPDEASLANGYGPVKHNGETIFRSVAIDRKFQSGWDLELKLGDDSWRTLKNRLRERPGLYEEALRMQFNRSAKADPPKDFFNESKLCLRSDLFEGAKEAKVFCGEYFASFLTNELCTKLVEMMGSRPTREPVARHLYPRYDHNQQWHLKSLSSSVLGNHIGVSTLAFTSDNHLIFWRQAEIAAQSEGLDAPPGSGSCDCSDLDPTSFRRTIVNGMQRELCEESIRKRTRRLVREGALESTEILGFFRWIRRAGKPEFVGITKIKLPAEELEPQPEVDEPDWELYRFFVPSLSSLRRVTSALMSDRSLSVPLFACLLNLDEALAADSDRWAHYFWPDQ